MGEGGREEEKGWERGGDILGYGWRKRGVLAPVAEPPGGGGKGWWVWIFVMGEVPCEGGGKGSDGAEGLFCSVDVGNTHGRIHGS